MTPWIEHDIAIVSVLTSKTIVSQGYSDAINVTVENLGSFTETFSVTIHANTTAIATQTLPLAIGAYTIVNFTWNTTGLACGNYVLTGVVTLAPGETNLWTGPFTYGTVKVTIPGDINGDAIVNAKDLGILATYWLETVPPAPANVDIGGYGIVNAKDLGIMATYWLQSWT
jgi:hypothetical protein